MPKGGLEPPCREAHEPESCVSANFTTSAHRYKRTPPPGGADQVRTDDPHNAIVVLYQLSYDPAPRQLYRTKRKKDRQSHNAKTHSDVRHPHRTIVPICGTKKEPLECPAIVRSSAPETYFCTSFSKKPSPTCFIICLKKCLPKSQYGDCFFVVKNKHKKILHSAKNSHRFESCL